MAEGTLLVNISNQSIHVSSVTVTAPIYFITSPFGTLQMTAAVLPADADDPSVTWSVISGTGTAAISSAGLLTALSNGYVTVRATARDGSGIYGGHIVDISGQVPPPPTTGLKDRDGNLYTTVNIGTQQWIVENLKTTHYADGTAILNLKTCTNPNGGLYNWYAVIYNTGGASIAPAGWHVPTLAEWQTLLNHLDTYDSINNRWPLAGNYLRETGTDHWYSTSADVTNSTGFTAFGAGFRQALGDFQAVLSQAYFWSSTQYDFNTGNVLNLSSTSLALLNDNPSNKNNGHSIRLIKNDAVDPGKLTDIDGNIYNTVTIGSQVWMAENLKVTKYNNGTAIPELTTDFDWKWDSVGAMCYYDNDAINGGWSTDATGAYVWYDNLIANKDPYGALYNWYAVDNVKGLAYLEQNGTESPGWHVPTQAELQTLSTYLGGDAISGGKLKEIGLTHWITPNTGADNESGFTGVGAGNRLYDCSFNDINYFNRYWAATELDIDSAYFILLSYDSDDSNFDDGDKNIGSSVRLVRDIASIPPEAPDAPVPPTYPEVIPYTYGAIPEYRFYISTASSLTYEVFPLKFLSSTIVYELEGEQVFYRRKFNGSLLFGTNSLVGMHNRKEDWDLFWGIEQFDPEEKLYLTITKEFGGFIETYWDGYFATSDGNFDIDICTFEVTPIAIDDYTDVLDLADTQYNIINVPSMGTVTATYEGSAYNYTRTRWLARIGSDNVLEYIAHQMIPGSTVVSDFFTEFNNPITLAANKLLYLVIAQKSDITRYSSSDAATTAMLSWNELMDILWGMFQVRWNYNLITNTFTIEHNSQFTYTAGIDLRAQLSCVATNKYRYLKDKMPKYENFSMMEADGVNFVGTSIYYDSGGINQDPKSNSSDFTIPVVTDIEYLMKGGGTGSDEGFVILCPELNGAVYNVRGEFGRLDNNYYALNMDLSIANLQHDYFRYDRVLPTGYLNGLLVTFFSSRKTKQQECSAILCEELDPTGDITTELGETYFGGAKAIIKTASLSPTGEIKFVLLYGPLPALNPGTPDLFGVFAVPSLTSTLVPDDTVEIEFTFTAPCPGDYTVRIQQFVYDAGSMVHDVGAWETVVFLTGTTSYSFTPVYTHQIDPGWTVRLFFEYTGSEIDNFRGKTDPKPAFMFALPYDYIVL